MKFPEIRLAPLYHRLRNRLGLPVFEEERVRRQILLHPDEKPAVLCTEQDEKRLRLSALVLAGAGLLTLAAWLNGKPVPYSTLARPDYGAGEEELVLQAELSEQSYEVPLLLESRRYTDAEWEELSGRAWDTLREEALSENQGWDQIRSDLDLRTDTGIPGVKAEWLSSQPEWIGSDGRLGDPAEIPDGQEVVLTAVLSSDGYSREEQLTAVLRTSPLTEEERIGRLIRNRVTEAAADPHEAEVTLPDELMGEPLRFLKRDSPSPLLFLLLGILTAAALWKLPEQREQETEKARRKALSAAYPELISTLVVLMGAGLTVRGAWERMVMSYRRSLLTGGSVSVLYEEMSLTLNSLSQGTFEEAAYEAFGKRCGLQPYLRLGSLLESNLKMGSRGLIPLMKEEAENALESRLRDARKQGEEASTKLLVPMILLFSLVVGMLVFPAFLSFA